MDNLIGRGGWPGGPWDDEPDILEWQHFGFECLLLRTELGSWCGYVGVPPEHPAYDKHYNKVEVSVHGGLTYAGECRPGRVENLWWLGFDCAHAYDLIPGMMNTPGLRSIMRGCTYKDLAYVKHETEELAEQLAEMAVEASKKSGGQNQMGFGIEG